MGARPSINHDQVRLMIETGLSDSHIAKRLHCSRKQIQRIRQLYNIERKQNLGHIIGSPAERELWKMFLEYDKTYARVAYRFGLTRARITQELNQLREAI